jgi:hypothetical protein
VVVDCLVSVARNSGGPAGVRLRKKLRAIIDSACTRETRGRNIAFGRLSISFAFRQMAFEGSCLMVSNSAELCQMVAVVGFNLETRELGKMKEQLSSGED